MGPIQSALTAVGLAAALSGLLSLLGWLLRRRAATPESADGAGALAVGGGYVAGYAWVAGWPPLPPREALHRLFWVAAAAVVLGLLGFGMPRGKVLLRLLPPALLTGVAVLLLGPRVGSAWDGLTGAAVLGTLVAAGLVLWALSSKDGAAPAVPVLPVAATVLATAPVLVLSGSAMLGELAGVLLAALVPTLWRTSAAGIATVLLAGLWLAGLFTTDLPPVCILLLAAASLTALCPRLPRLQPVRWRGAAVRAGLVALPLALAVGLAFHYSTPDDGLMGGGLPIPSLSGSASEPQQPAGPPRMDDNPFADAPR
jgi:hypothetical protein